MFCPCAIYLVTSLVPAMGLALAPNVAAARAAVNFQPITAKHIPNFMRGIFEFALIWGATFERVSASRIFAVISD